MTGLLSMPILFASSLVVLAVVAAFFSIKFVVLALSLDQGAHSAREDRRMGRHMNRRSTDCDSGGNVVLS